MASDPRVETIILMARPKPEHGFSPLSTQMDDYEKYLGVVRPMIAALMPPVGFSADEWAICRAYLLSTSHVFKVSETPAADLADLHLAFKKVWPEMWPKLSAHMGESWARAEAETPSTVRVIELDSFEIVNDDETGKSTITVTDKNGAHYRFTGAYPMSIDVGVPLSSDTMTFSYEFGPTEEQPK